MKITYLPVSLKIKSQEILWFIGKLGGGPQPKNNIPLDALIVDYLNFFIIIL